MTDQDPLEKLFNTRKEEYTSDYYGHLIEIYKVYVEMADRVSARRQSSNSFYLTINSLLIAIGTLITSFDPGIALLILLIPGIALNLLWMGSIASFKDLNSGKFKVINKIETRLPIMPYDTEWIVLGRGTEHSKYRPFHKVERWVPFIFIFMYCLLAGFGIFHAYCN